MQYLFIFSLATRRSSKHKAVSSSVHDRQTKRRKEKGTYMFSYHWQSRSCLIRINDPPTIFIASCTVCLWWIRTQFFGSIFHVPLCPLNKNLSCTILGVVWKSWFWKGLWAVLYKVVAMKIWVGNSNGTEKWNKWPLYIRWYQNFKDKFVKKDKGLSWSWNVVSRFKLEML